MSIKNSHVAQVYDVDIVDGSPFIVMEHLPEGASFRDAPVEARLADLEPVALPGTAP
jgi:hypothetical protein